MENSIEVPEEYDINETLEDDEESFLAGKWASTTRIILVSFIGALIVAISFWLIFKSEFENNNLTSIGFFGDLGGLPYYLLIGIVIGSAIASLTFGENSSLLGILQATGFLGVFVFMLSSFMSNKSFYLVGCIFFILCDLYVLYQAFGFMVNNVVAYDDADEIGDVHLYLLIEKHVWWSRVMMIVNVIALVVLIYVMSLIYATLV